MIGYFINILVGGLVVVLSYLATLLIILTYYDRQGKAKRKTSRKKR